MPQYRDQNGNLVAPFNRSVRSRRIVETVLTDLSGEIISTESTTESDWTPPKVNERWEVLRNNYTVEQTPEEIQAEFEAAKSAIYQRMVDAWNAIEIVITAESGNIYGPLPMDPTRRGANNDGYSFWAATVSAGGTPYDLQMEGINGVPVVIGAADVQSAFQDFMRQFTVLNLEWNAMIEARDNANTIAELPTVEFTVESNPN